MTVDDVLPEKGLLENAATIKKCEHLPLGSELKKQTGIAKDQYKFFKDQINVNNINRENILVRAYNFKQNHQKLKHCYL